MLLPSDGPFPEPVVVMQEYGHQVFLPHLLVHELRVLFGQPFDLLIGTFNAIVCVELVPQALMEGIEKKTLTLSSANAGRAFTA